jgi:diguanylate cyclase (GGDEF)-like protein
MQAPSQAFSLLSAVGVVADLGGALMLIALFVLLRHFVLRREYFSAWANAWMAFAVAIGALVLRTALDLGGAASAFDDDHVVVRFLYFIHQISKTLGLLFFVRGAVMYVAGSSGRAIATRTLWTAATVFGIVTTLASDRGLNEMILWQSAAAVPSLALCAVCFFRLPRPRRTTGSAATAVGFALLAALWLVHAIAFWSSFGGALPANLAQPATFVAFYSYFDLTLNAVLGYAMIVLLMEDAKREFDAAQAELRVTHDQLRRAALYDSLTDSLNRHAYAAGVGLDMVRATFGTVVLGDLDNLKEVNDRYGHAAGDQLLRHCADVFRATLRPYDKLYRWGGDEFLLIVPSAHTSDVLDRLVSALDAAETVHVGHGSDDGIRLHVSLGGAEYTNSEQLSRAIDRADRAMYEEKGRRKNWPRQAVIGAPPSPSSVHAVR